MQMVKHLQDLMFEFKFPALYVKGVLRAESPIVGGEIQSTVLCKHAEIFLKTQLWLRAASL